MVTLTALIAAAAIPSINSARELYRLTTSRDELTGVIESTRSEAVKRDIETTITISSTGQYTAQYVADGTTRTMNYALPAGVSLTLPSGVTTVTIRCKPSGQITMTGNNGSRVTALTLGNRAGQKGIGVTVAGNIYATS